MPQKYANNARTKLASGISASDTSISVLAGSGDLFPFASANADTLPSSNDWFKLFLTDVSGEIEIVGVRTRASGSDVLSNVVRAMDGTTARVWGVGAVAYLALSANDFQTALREWNTVPIQNGTTGRALIKSDVGKTVPASGAVTLLANVFAKDDVIIVYNDSAANININKDSGVTMWWVNAENANRVLQPRGLASILCIRANEFVITGQGVE